MGYALVALLCLAGLYGLLYSLTDSDYRWVPADPKRPWVQFNPASGAWRIDTARFVESGEFTQQLQAVQRWVDRNGR